jgi:hypothetical protein
MPTYLAFTIDDLDAEIKKRDAAVSNYADFSTRRERAYERAIADLEETLASQDSPFVRADTYAAALTTGTAKVSTPIGDLYTIDLPADGRRVAGSNILVEGATTFLQVPRMSWDAVVLGTSQTLYAFWEDNGQIVLYEKDAEFTAPADVHISYYRKLDTTQTTGTNLDIPTTQFSSIVTATLNYMKD